MVEKNTCKLILLSGKKCNPKTITDSVLFLWEKSAKYLQKIQYPFQLVFGRQGEGLDHIVLLDIIHLPTGQQELQPLKQATNHKL